MRAFLAHFYTNSCLCIWRGVGFCETSHHHHVCLLLYVFQLICRAIKQFFFSVCGAICRSVFELYIFFRPLLTSLSPILSSSWNSILKNYAALKDGCVKDKKKLFSLLKIETIFQAIPQGHIYQVISVPYKYYITEVGFSGSQWTWWVSNRKKTQTCFFGSSIFNQFYTFFPFKVLCRSPLWKLHCLPYKTGKV